VSSGTGKVFQEEAAVSDGGKITLRHGWEIGFYIRTAVNADAAVQDLQVEVDDSTAMGKNLYHMEVTNDCTGLSAGEKVYYFNVSVIGETTVTISATDGSGVSTVFSVEVIPYDEWIEGNDGRRHYTKERMDTDFTEIDGETYYFNENGIMQTGFQMINGKKYYFDSEGILKAEVPSEIRIPPESLNITARSTVALDVETDVENLQKDSLAWTSGAPTIVTVNAAGVLTPVSNGETTITVSSIYDPSVTCTIPVKVAFAVNMIRATRGILEDVDGSTVFWGEEDVAEERRIQLRHNLDPEMYLRVCVNTDAAVKTIGYLYNEENAIGLTVTEISDICAGLTEADHVFRIEAGEIGEAEIRFFALDESGKEVCFTVAVIPYDEWIVGEDGSKRHFTKDKMDVGWKTIGKKTYYFDQNGIMQKGWQEIDGNWYYLKKGVMVDGWQQIGGKWYFFRKGAMQTDWQKMNGKWYYLKKGVMVTGWKQLDGTWYYFNTDGSAARGWTQVGGKWYFFKDGAMQVGWLKTDGKWYYLKDGVMITGWKQLDGKWYFFDKSGAMTRGWQKIGGKWYFFKNGVMLTGWAKFDGKWYFFDQSGVMVTGDRKIGSKVYEFDAEGVCLNP
ncbi:MAG: Ig-like domain-containing protein, partial [Eubacterium sp.]|nr:Ig-like domain-containing protein [Eubacterium sp.]